jgi:hypothetical protein
MEKPMAKNKNQTKTGSELATLRWAKATPEDRRAQGERLSKIVSAAWAKVPAKKRSAMMTALAKRPRPNTRLPEHLRCPCGIMSLDRAKKRNHKCQKPPKPRAA